MRSIQNTVLGLGILLALGGCFAVRPCNSSFLEKSLHYETALRRASDYIHDHMNTASDVRVFGIDSIGNKALRDSLKMLDIGTIYVHNKKVYDYEYPQDHTIAFSKSYVPLKTNRHELVIISFQRPETLEPQKNRNGKNGTRFCRIREDVFYYSY